MILTDTKVWDSLVYSLYFGESYSLLESSLVCEHRMAFNISPLAVSVIADFYKAEL